MKPSFVLGIVLAAMILVLPVNAGHPVASNLVAQESGSAVPSAAVHHCPKCHGEMVEGFLYGERKRSIGPLGSKFCWVPGGPPEYTFMGSDVRPNGPRRDISALRCSGCGFLELYAN